MSVDDGLGIRTTVFMKGCPLRCRWCHNPEGLDPRPQLNYYTEEMQECCDGYLQYVTERAEAMKAEGFAPQVYVEQQVDLRRFIPESMGTSDCVIVGLDEICIVDFKYGMYPVLSGMNRRRSTCCST